MEEIFKWDEILQEILESSDFQEQIRQNRYFQSPQNLNFRDWIKKRFGKTSRVNTASLLSLDFWNQQRPILRNKAYYLIRSGKGSFVIFDEKKFYSSYLNSEELKKAEVNAKTIDAFEPKGYEYLKKAFKENIVENTALEQLRFNGVYEKMIENVLGEKRQ